MTDQQLIDLVLAKSPEDLTPEEIDLLRARLADSAELREVLVGQLRMESYLATALGPPAVTVDDILKRARKEDATPTSPGQVLLVAGSSLLLVALVAGVFFGAWRLRSGQEEKVAARLTTDKEAEDRAKAPEQTSGRDKSPGEATAKSDDANPAPGSPASKPPLADKLPLAIEAENFVRGNVKADSSEWGTADLTIIRTGAQPAFAEYEFELREARRLALRVRYASFDSQPLRLSINGKQQPQFIAGEQTGGHAPSAQKWFPAGEFDFPAGKNVLRLETTASFPHLDQLSLAVPEASPAPTPGVKPPAVAEKEAPWREALERPGDPPTFAEACFETFRTDKSLPQRDDLHRWFAPVDGQRYRVFDNKTRLGQCAAFEGLIRLKAPWRNDSALKLSLESYDRLQIHLFSGDAGVTLVYIEPENFRWSAYTTTRKAASPRPERFVLVGMDAERNRRSEIRFGGPFELRHRDGEVILSRGDVVLLRAPLANPPQEVYFDGKASFHGISLVRTQDFPPPEPQRPATAQFARPADLPWIKQLKAGARVETTPEGAIELRAESAAEKGWIAAPLPRLGLHEVVMELADASPGAGVFLGRKDGQPLEVLRFTRNQRDGGLCLMMHPGDDGRELDFATPVERFVPATGGHVWVKLLLGAGTLRWWMSDDGTHWVQPEYPVSGLAGGISHIGLHYLQNTPNCRLRLTRIELRELAEFAALAPPELREAAPALHTAANFDEWLALADKARPQGADASAWRRAVAINSLAAGCGQDLGWRLVDTLLDDAASRGLPLARQLKLLDEAVLLCDQRGSDLITNNFLARYGKVGLAEFEARGGRPFTAVRQAAMTAPFSNQVSMNIRLACEPAIRTELIALLHHGQWDETLRFCERLRFYKQDDQLPLVEFAEYTARRNTSLRTGGEGVVRQHDEWRHPYSEQLNKETYNLLAELEAILESDAFADAARMLTSLDVNSIVGVAPHGRDRELYVSLAAAIRLALREHPPLEVLLKEKFGPLAQLRVRSAITEGNAAAVQLAAAQFESTEAAAEAHRWLGDRALASGWFGRALAEYRRAETTAEASVREDLGNRLRLTAAMIGEDAGQPATRNVQFGETRLAPAEFEALVAQMKQRAAGGSDRSGTSAAVPFAPPAPPPTAFEVQRRSRFEGPVGENPAGEVTRHTVRHKVDWVSRQLATAVEGDVLYASNRFQVAAYNLGNGQLKWRGLPPPGKMLRSQDWTLAPMRPLVTSKYVIARQLFGAGPTLTCFDKGTGHYVWSNEPRQNEYTVSDPLLVQDQLVCLSLARQENRESQLRLSIYDLDTGDLLTQYPLADLRESWWQRRLCEVAAIDDAVIASLGGLVVCADLAGNVRWVRRQVAMPAEEESTWVQQHYDRPLIHERRIYLAQPGVRSLECLDPDTGARHFSVVLPSVQRLVGIAGGRLIVQTDRDLRALDAKSGALLWTHGVTDLLQAQACGGPGGILYAKSEPTEPNGKTLRPRLVWLDAASGQPRALAPLAGLEDPDPRLGPLVATRDRLFTFFGRSLADPNRDVIELIPKGEADKPPTTSGLPDVWTRK